MEWLEITKAIGELGILIVIAGLFLFFYYKDKTARDAEFKQLFDAILGKETHVLTEEEDRLAKHIEKSITAELQEITNTLQPTRTLLVRYHNGGKDMNGISFLKLSVTNECTNRGVAPVMKEYQNQFRSSINEVCFEIDKNGYMNIPSKESIKEKDRGTYDLMVAKHVRSTYNYALRNATGYIIGFISIIYYEDNATIEDIDTIKQVMSDKATEISTLLSVKEG